MASVKAGRKDEAERAAKMLGAEIEFFDCGDYPLKLNEAHFDRMVDIYRELNPSFVLTHALEDPYNFDHPDAAHFAQQTRVVAQAMGHKPDAKYQYSAPPVFLFEPHQPEQCNFKPQVILNIDDVWEVKRKTFEILAAQKHLWAYHECVALNRDVQGGRNSGVTMTMARPISCCSRWLWGTWHEEHCCSQHRTNYATGEAARRAGRLRPPTRPMAATGR